MIPSELDRFIGDKIRQLPKEAQELLQVITLYYETKIQELESRIKGLSVYLLNYQMLSWSRIYEILPSAVRQ